MKAPYNGKRVKLTDCLGYSGYGRVVLGPAPDDGIDYDGLFILKPYKTIHFIFEDDPDGPFEAGHANIFPDDVLEYA